MSPHPVESSTRNFPPRLPEDLDPGHKGEAGMIHPVMHPGIWLDLGTSLETITGGFNPGWPSMATTNARGGP